MSNQPLRKALLQTLDGLADMIPAWLPPGPAELSTEDENNTRREVSPPNLAWMVATCRENINLWPVDKISRWIGFVQGVLACKSVEFSVAAERDRTRPFFHEAYAQMGLKPPPSAEMP